MAYNGLYAHSFNHNPHWRYWIVSLGDSASYIVMQFNHMHFSGLITFHFFHLNFFSAVETELLHSQGSIS